MKVEQSVGQPHRIDQGGKIKRREKKKEKMGQEAIDQDSRSPVERDLEKEKDTH